MRCEIDSKNSRKSLPLDRKEADLWHRFVIAAYRGRVIAGDEPLIDWLVSVGWPHDAAIDLNSLLIDQCLLLSSYQDEVSAA